MKKAHVKGVKRVGKYRRNEPKLDQETRNTGPV